MISSITINEIKKRANSREIVFWGKHDGLLEELKTQGMVISKIYTGNTHLLKKSNQYYNYNELRGMANKYFIIFPFWSQEKIQVDYYSNKLKELGYSKDDWLSLTPELTANLGENRRDKRDIYGNKCSPIPKGVKQLIQGYDNKIDISKIENNGNITIIIKGNNNRIVIEENVKFRGNNLIHCMGDNIRIHIKQNVSINSIDIEVWSNSCLIIGKDTTMAENNHIYMHNYSKMLLGTNCKTSFNVLLQTGDGHSIFSVKTGENINSSKKHITEEGYLSEIILGEHVWLCRDSKIISSMNSTTIGTGSIVGMGSIVKGIFPNNCAIAGVPARVVKEDIAWASKNMSDDITDCKGYAKLTVY